jgi:ParB-like chromosome segregation protein Spo0J
MIKKQKTLVEAKFHHPLEFHPLANTCPLMDEDSAEFKELVEDIKRNGLQKPIAIYQGMILDGRNRYRAYIAAGFHEQVIPRIDVDKQCVMNHLGEFVTNDDQARAFVKTANIHRKHYTAEEKRDAIAALIAADPAKSDREIGRAVGVDHKTVGKVRKVKESTGEVSPVEKRTGEGWQGAAEAEAGEALQARAGCHRRHQRDGAEARSRGERARRDRAGDRRAPADHR